jgi:hypothetical protein
MGSKPNAPTSTIPDLIASKILTGKTPRILQALRFDPRGRTPDLQRVNLLGEVPISPEEDFFRAVIEQRKRAQARDTAEEDRAVLSTRALDPIAKRQAQTPKVSCCGDRSRPIRSTRCSPARRATRSSSASPARSPRSATTATTTEHAPTPGSSSSQYSKS